MEENKKILSLNPNFICLNFSLADYRTYVTSSVLVAGSVLLPYILHQFNLAGQIFLPIYFFTLIGAYKFGWKVGVMTGVFSPLVSFILTGMPALMILPFVVMKGVFLALIAGILAEKFGKLSALNLLASIIGYQVFGLLAMYIFSHNLVFSTADLVMGYPGLILQMIGGYILLRFIGGYGRKKLDTNSEQVR